MSATVHSMNLLNALLRRPKLRLVYFRFGITIGSTGVVLGDGGCGIDKQRKRLG